MGNSQATLQQKDTNRVNAAKYVEISAKHNKKMMHKNLKPLKQFSVIIKSIYVRTIYLKYDWALWLGNQLSKDINKLYEQYTNMFTLSLMKKNESSENFHIKNFCRNFIFVLQNQAKKLESKKFSMQDLQKLFEEVKCYFMVENWFLDLPLNNYLKNGQTTWSSNAKQNEHKQKKDSFFKIKNCGTKQTPKHPQKIYRILMKLTEIYFVNNYHVEEEFVPNQCESPRKNPMKRFNSRQCQLIRQISREQSFQERQGLIFELLDSIFKFEEKQNIKSQISVIEHKKLYALTRVLGLKNVYCVLKVLAQIGSIAQIQQVEYIFNYIMNKMVGPIRKKQQIWQIQKGQNKTSPTKMKNFNSPQKRKTSSKLKTESIR